MLFELLNTDPADGFPPLLPAAGVVRYSLSARRLSPVDRVPAASAQQITEDGEGGVVAKVGPAWCAGGVDQAEAVTSWPAERPESVNPWANDVLGRAGVAPVTAADGTLYEGH